MIQFHVALGFFMNMTPTIAIHMSAAITALAIGPVALWARKGRTQRPKLHRAFGYAWVTLMIVTAVSALFIRDYQLPNIAGYSLIHLFVPFVIYNLTRAFYHLSQGNLAAHSKAMSGTYWGACVAAGVFTLLPGRYLGDLLWGAPSNAAKPLRPLIEVVSPIFSRTPVWVWGLLAVLVILGLMLARTRVLSLPRLVIVPIVMMVLSFLGTISAAGLSITTVAIWLIAFAAMAYTLSRTASAGESYDDATQRFTVKGSYIPLTVMMATFLTKYAVGAMTGMSSPLIHTQAFAVVIAALYGGFSGVFAGRALRLIQLKHN